MDLTGLKHPGESHTTNPALNITEHLSWEGQTRKHDAGDVSSEESDAWFAGEETQALESFKTGFKAKHPAS